MNRLTSREKGKNAMAELTIPIVVNWDDIKDRMSKGNIVEVIRCKDCRHWFEGTCFVESDSEYDDFNYDRDENDFCSRAEKKENAEKIDDDESKSALVCAVEMLEKSNADDRISAKWIGGEIGYCSACGHRGIASDIWNRCTAMYCPNCGRKMEG